MQKNNTQSFVSEEIFFVQKYLIAGFLEFGAEEYKGILTVKMFGKFGKIFEQIRDNGPKKVPELFILLANLGDGLGKELLDLSVQIPTRFELPIYAKKLFQFYIADNKESSIEHLDKVKQVFDRIESLSTGSKRKGILQTFMAVEDIIEDNKSKGDGAVGFSTGIPTVDKYCSGIRPGTVMRINAYSNTGKSKLSYFITNNILRAGKKVAYFSLEVTPEMVLINLLANWYREDFHTIERGRKEMDFGEYYEVCKNNLEILDPKYSELSEIERYVELHKPEFICIDYIQNISVRGANSEYEQMTEISRRLQTLAVANKVAILDLSQISNEGFQYKVGGMIPSKGSGALVAAADVGLMLYSRDGILKLAIAKNKFGNKDIETTLKADFSKGIFIDAMPDDIQL